MAFSFVPQVYCPSIYALSVEALQKNGIRLVLLDLDNTLLPYRSLTPSADLRHWLSALQEANIQPFILSNSRKPTRVSTVAADLSLPFLAWAGKPKRKGFRKALLDMNASPAETIMVGDQIFTDILGANRSEMLSVLVDPIAQDTVFRRLRFWLETPFRRRAKRQGGL